MSILSKKRIYEIYEAFSAGKFDTLRDMFDEHVDFRSYAPSEVFPYLGHRVGRAEAMDALRKVHSEFETLTVIPILIVVEGDMAAAIVSIRAIRRATGHTIYFVAAHFLHFREDRIIEYRSVLDSFEAVKQVLGHEIDLNVRPKPA